MRAHDQLLRDIFGNPFRPIAFDPEWRTDTAITLARQMYDSRDFSAAPILADITVAERLDVHLAIFADGREIAAVGREFQGPDPLRVSAEVANELAIGRVPQLDEVVVAAGRDARSIGTDC